MAADLIRRLEVAMPTQRFDYFQNRPNCWRHRRGWLDDHVDTSPFRQFGGGNFNSMPRKHRCLPSQRRHIDILLTFSHKAIMAFGLGDPVANWFTELAAPAGNAD
jgi:hypothetical protein